jgi:7-keto-8-aminopelargonate synthetase-like enzyme
MQKRKKLTKGIDMDIFEKCYCYTKAKEFMKTGYYPYFIAMEGNEGSEAVFQGRRLIMCGSNNYLGLTIHPKVRQAASKPLKSTEQAAQVVFHEWELLHELEGGLANGWAKAALVFSTGYRSTWVPSVLSWQGRYCDPG